jgi:hypothetical protein
MSLCSHLSFKTPEINVKKTENRKKPSRGPVSRKERNTTKNTNLIGVGCGARLIKHELNRCGMRGSTNKMRADRLQAPRVAWPRLIPPDRSIALPARSASRPAVIGRSVSCVPHGSWSEGGKPAWSASRPAVAGRSVSWKSCSLRPEGMQLARSASRPAESLSWARHDLHMSHFINSTN